MKDRELEEKFEGYFEGVKAPENMTADAKKYVKPRRFVMPKFTATQIRRLVYAFSGIVLVAMVSLLGVFYFNGFPRAGENGSTSDAPDAVVIYYENELESTACSVSSLYEMNNSLKFLQDLDFKKNASVNNCTAYTANGKLTLVKSDLSMLEGLNRYETEIYVEFAESVFSPLQDYFCGEKRAYNGYEYYLTKTTAENGEPGFKLLVNKRGIKYYFDVTSSDEAAYEKFLKIILN